MAKAKPVSQLTPELLYRLAVVRGRLGLCQAAGFDERNTFALLDALGELELQMEVEGLR